MVNQNSKPARKHFRFSDNACFGIIMQNTEIASKVIKAILPYEIEDIKSVDTEKSYMGKVNGKQVRFDAYMISTDGKVVDMEMQQHPETNLAKRLRFYQAQIDMLSTERGQAYAKICESYIIFITTYDPFGLGKAVYTFERFDSANRLALDTHAHWLVLNSSAWEDKTLSPALADLLCYTYTGKTSDKCKLSSMLDAEVRKLNNKSSEVDNVVTMEDKMIMDRVDYEEFMNKKIAAMAAEQEQMAGEIKGYKKQIDALLKELAKYKQPS